MDQGTRGSTQGISAPVANDTVILELPWPMKEPQDQPSAVYSSGQPLSDNTCGSLLSLNTSHACQLCSAVFLLSSSLEVHMETFHRETRHSELPVVSRLHDSVCGEDTDETPSGPEGFSTHMTGHSGEDSLTSSIDFVIKLELPWSIKEEPQDQPSAVYSPVQPLSDSTSGSLLSLNTSHVCPCCAAAFVLFSSWELHMVTFHGETLHDFFRLYSAYKCYNGAGYHHGSKHERVRGFNKKAVKGWEEKVENNCNDGTDQRKKPRRYLCDICNKAFLKLSHLKRHQSIHTGHKLFVCDVCNRAFTEPGHLKAHRLIHTGDKSYVCDVCSKAFARLCYLRTHKLTHTGQKPFVCDVCSKGFTESGSLRKHKLIHSGYKSFVCDLCSKAFTQSAHLKTHKLTHTGQKAFTCDVCRKTFTLSCALKRHKKKFHIEERTEGV